MLNLALLLCFILTLISSLHLQQTHLISADVSKQTA